MTRRPLRTATFLLLSWLMWPVDMGSAATMLTHMNTSLLRTMLRIGMIDHVVPGPNSS